MLLASPALQERPTGAAVNTVQSSVAEDAALVRRAQALDHEALSEIYTTYQPRVLNYALSQLRDPQAAEDVASDVMLKVLEAIGRYRFNGVPLAAWVFRIARNALIDVRRRRSRFAGCSLPEGLASPGADTAARVEEALDRDRLHEAMRGLREEHRHVLVLRFMEGLNTAEVAYVMGRSQSSVKALQYRALNRLRRTMAGDSRRVSCEALIDTSLGSAHLAPRSGA